MSRNRIISVIVLLVAVYCGSYLYLTVRGSYQPVTLGLNGRNTYAWAPQGFVENYHWNRFKIAFYAPLYGCDLRFWHTSERARTGRYPINVPPMLVPTKAM
jgi:hypothetical protein